VSGSYRYPGLRILAGLVFPLLATQTALPETGLSVSPTEVDRASESNSVRANIDRMLATLSSVVMKEKISRFAGAGGGARQLDSFETEVSIADGVEQYTGVRGHHRIYRHISEIGGLWSFGEIVTMLRTTRDIIDSSTTNREPEGGVFTGGAAGPEEAQAQRVIRFQGASASHRWFVTAHNRIYWLDFEGAIRISMQTGEIERLTWTSTAGPPEAGISSILWDVTFHGVSIAGNALTIPSDSIYRVIRRGPGRTAEWNLTEYLALGRYGSNVNVRYGQ